jgi:hypothetical protein
MLLTQDKLINEVMPMINRLNSWGKEELVRRIDLLIGNPVSPFELRGMTDTEFLEANNLYLDKVGTYQWVKAVLLGWSICNTQRLTPEGYQVSLDLIQDTLQKQALRLEEARQHYQNS